MLILIAEDDASLGKTLNRLFALEGYQTVLVTDGFEALQELEENDYGLVVLDWNMPECDGFEVCRQMRNKGDETPVLMLTARDELDDKVSALDIGADDYVVKPFATKELVARVNALRRRSSNVDEILEYEGLKLDGKSHKAFFKDTEIKLGRIEWRLLAKFLESPEEVCSAPEIYRSVWGYNFKGLSNTLEVHIGYLRKRLEKANAPKLIHTVRGYGYVLRQEEDEKA